MTPEKAEETLKSVLYYGVMMVKEGLADGMVAGRGKRDVERAAPVFADFKDCAGDKARFRVFCDGCSGL